MLSVLLFLFMPSCFTHSLFYTAFSPTSEWEDKQQVLEAQNFCLLAPHVEEILQSDELELVGKNMNNGATPGVDGLPIKF